MQNVLLDEECKLTVELKRDVRRFTSIEDFGWKFELTSDSEADEFLR